MTKNLKAERIHYLSTKLGLVDKINEDNDATGNGIDEDDEVKGEFWDQ